MQCQSNHQDIGEGNLIILKQPIHTSHPPNREEQEAEKITYRIKQRAQEYSEQTPAQLLRTKLLAVPETVINFIPERENFKNSIRRVKNRNLFQSIQSH